MEEIAIPYKDVMRFTRLRLGLGQKEIASQMGIKQATYSLWESGSRQPSQATLERFAIATGYETYNQVLADYKRLCLDEKEENSTIKSKESNEEANERKQEYTKLINNISEELDIDSLDELLKHAINIYSLLAENMKLRFKEHVDDLTNPNRFGYMMEYTKWFQSYTDILKQATMLEETYKQELQAQLDAQTESGQTEDAD